MTEFEHASDDFWRIYEALRFVLDHPDPLFYVAVVLGAAQDWVLDLLSTVFYLVFVGGPGTGKSTAIRACMSLTRRGVVLGSATGPYLRETLKEERAIGISEFGALFKENPQLLAIVRNGYQRATSKFGLMVAEGKGWRKADVEVFGFKAMDAHGTIDSHVLGRSLSFEMFESPNLRLAVEAEYLEERLAPLKDVLRRLSAKAKQEGWNADRVKATMRSSTFLRRVKKFERSWGRHGVMAADMLLLSDILGFGLEDDIRQLMNGRLPELSDEAQMLKEMLLDRAKQELVTEETELLVSDDVLRPYNWVRKDHSLPPVSSVTAQLRELGFSVRKRTWVPASKNMSGPNRKKAVIRPYTLIGVWEGGGGIRWQGWHPPVSGATLCHRCHRAAGGLWGAAEGVAGSAGPRPCRASRPLALRRLRRRPLRGGGLGQAAQEGFEEGQAAGGGGLAVIEIEQDPAEWVRRFVYDDRRGKGFRRSWKGGQVIHGWLDGRRGRRPYLSYRVGAADGLWDEDTADIYALVVEAVE